MPSAGLESPPTVPAAALRDGDFVAECHKARDSLIYLLLNVGDGDTQLLLLPREESEDPTKLTRRALVIDVASTKKLPLLLEALTSGDRPVLPKPESGPLLSVVVATHPHDDHIGGMPEFLDRFRNLIGEFWEPGYYHPSARYIEMMRALEDSNIPHLQPTSGSTRFIGKVKITALSPGIVLRSRFDSYGTEINDASIALRIEFPAARLKQEGENRRYLRLRDPWAMILGADAQTTSWAQATLDFPQLHAREGSALYKELRAAMGADPLKAHIFKVPHHGSKHGLNIELVERIGPRVSLVSSTGGSGRYGFPHYLAVEAIREALKPVVTTRAERKPDHQLGIHYTSAVEDRDPPKPLGSIALIIPPKPGARLRIWRFGDKPNDPIHLDKGREFVPNP